jgi:hypothetical protein
MATLNFIMPDDLKDGFCEREEKTNKVKHSWFHRDKPEQLWATR